MSEIQIEKDQKFNIEVKMYTLSGSENSQIKKN